MRFEGVVCGWEVLGLIGRVPPRLEVPRAFPDWSGFRGGRLEKQVRTRPLVLGSHSVFGRQVATSLTVFRFLNCCY